MDQQHCPECGQVVAVGTPGEPNRCPQCQETETVTDKDAVPGTVDHGIPSWPPSLPPIPTTNAQITPSRSESVTFEIALPRDLPGYDILSELGRGGMGIVYRAYQQALKRHVALKMILGAGTADPRELSRFQIEAEALGRLQHPNIVQIYEVGTYAGRPFFSLELVEGESLARKLAGTPLPPREAALLLEKLARAVHAAHASGIVHRDLKPANVLLTLAGEPKITDFGLAKRLDLDEGQTRTGAVMGTPGYMAPEQARGEGRQVGVAADVYSLGVMLYEFLTGSIPFRGPTPLDTLLQVVTEEPVPPSRLQPRTPADLETICLKCLCKDPVKRYASAAELADEVRRFLDGVPILARPVGTWERTCKWARRRPALAALVVVSSLGALTLLLGSLYFTHELRTERNHAVAERIDADLQRDRARRGEEEARQEKLRAEQGELEVRRQLERVRQALFTAHLTRVASLWQRDPTLGLNLLRDGQTCPPQFRDFAWHYYHRLCRAERGVFPLGLMTATGLTFSPDGHLLAASGNDGSIHVWDFKTQKLLRTWKGHKDEVAALLFTRDGKTLISGGKDRTIRQWDVGTGKQLKLLAKVNGWVGGLDLHPNGKLLAVSSYLDGKPNPWAPSDTFHKGEVLLLNLESGEKKTLLRGHAAALFSVAFNPDGSLLATGTTQTGLVKIWETATGKEYAEYRPRLERGDYGWVQRVTFTHDGKFLAVASADRYIHWWDVAARQEVKPWFAGHLRDVLRVQVSPDDQRLLSVGADRTVRLWDVASRRESLTLRDSAGPVLPVRQPGKVWQHDEDCFAAGLAFAPDGRGIVYQRGPELLHVALPDEAEAQTLRDHKDGLVQLAFSPDGRWLASSSRDGAVLLWNPETGARTNVGRFSTPVNTNAQLNLGKLGTAIRPIAFASDGKSLYLGAPAPAAEPGRKFSVVQCDLPTAKKPVPLGTHDALVSALAVAPRQPWLVSGSIDGVLKWWDLKTNQERCSFTQDKQAVRGLLFHPAEPLLAGHVGESLVVWSLTDSPPRVLHHRKVSPRCALAFSHDGQYLAVPQNQQAELLNPHTGAVVQRLGPASAPIQSLAFCPDRTTLAMGLEDRSVQLWNIPYNQPRATFTGHSNAVTALAFHPDGKLLASGGGDTSNALWGKSGEIKLWSARYSRAIGHAEPPTRLGSSADGSVLYTCAQDEAVILWDGATGRERTAWVSLSMGSTPIVAQTLTPDGQKHVTLYQDGTLAITACATGAELALLKSTRTYLPQLFFSADGQTLALLTVADSLIQLVDLRTHQEVRILPLPVPLRNGPLCLSPDFHWLVQRGESKGELEILDLHTGARRTVAGKESEPTILYYLSGDRLVIGTGGDTLTVRALASGEILQVLRGHAGTVLGVAQSRTRPLLATLAIAAEPARIQDGEPQLEIRCWNLESGQPQGTPRKLLWQGHPLLTFLPNAELLLAQTQGTGLKVQSFKVP